MKICKLIALGVVFTIALAALAGDVTFEELFHVAPKDARKVFGDKAAKQFELALADFNAVLSGKQPINAKPDTNAPTIWDGGTRGYIGDGYKLTVVKSMTSMPNIQGKRIDGFIYGPVLTFDQKVMPGNGQPISHTSFYSIEALGQLLKDGK